MWGGKRQGAGRKKGTGPKKVYTHKRSPTAGAWGGYRPGSGRGLDPHLTIERDLGWLVYVVSEEGSDGPCKVGYSKSIRVRVSAMQSSNWRKLRVDAVFQTGTLQESIAVETSIHSALAHKHIRGEWFGATPAEISAIIAETLRKDGCEVVEMTGRSTPSFKVINFEKVG